ncbi:MAG TPA: alpha/beta fold hydrolase [Gaiellaceae bacterium]|jgi:pimeloyl-ACP methyl ester carboxylesterase|nr:alpha/beta fold hydrolase [Gaiellaceae bacterium]
MPALFIPGWGAHPSLYREALPPGWELLEPPTFRASRGSFAAYPAWLRSELDSRTGPFVLGGHSFGAALAVLAAGSGEVPVERLVLVNPAGLPLSKPNRACLGAFTAQLASGMYPLGPAARSIGSTLAAPRSALRLARTVRSLDLSAELEAVRRRGIPCTVVTAASDTLTPPDVCRRVARLAGGDYHELAVDGGHIWFLRAATQLRLRLAP